MNIEQEKLEQLADKARDMLASLDARPAEQRHPVFVEFAGTPKSGKSTCIDAINHFFRRVGYKVLAPTEGASKRTPYYLKENLVAFNAWSATYALTHILEGRYGADEYHLVIMDRGLFDALAWFELLRNRGLVTESECSTIQDFLLVGHWRRFVETVFLFKTDPAKSLKRENRDKLIREPGQAMNPEFLVGLNQAYDAIRSKYSLHFRQLHIVDTGTGQNTTPQSTAFEVAEKIMELMGQRAGDFNGS